MNYINKGPDTSISEKQVKNLDIKKAEDDEKLKEVCRDFESVFLYMMMKEMKNTLPEDGLIEKSKAMEIFEDMYMEEMSKEISSVDEGIGLAKMMYDQFKSQNIIIK